MEKNLPVKYLSQWDDDAKLSNNDCGAVSVAQIINFLGGNVTSDQVQEKTGAGEGLVSVEQLLTAIRSLGYVGEFYTGQTIDSLKRMIDKDIPVIVLVHYGSLNSTQDQVFKGGHFMPIVGYRADNGVYANDPNFQGDIRSQGDHHNYTNAEFMKAWGDATNDGNPPFTFIAITKMEQPQTEVKKVKVITEKGLNGRSAPIISSSIVNVFIKGTLLDVVSATTGDEVAGNKNWYEITGATYVWSGGVEVVKEEKPIPAPVSEKPKPVDPLVTAKEDIKALTKENDQLRKDNKKLTDTIQKLNDLTKAFVQVTSTDNNVTPVSSNVFSDLLKLLHLS